MRFSRMKHVTSEKLYFVYYLRNGVLSSERSPKIQGFKDYKFDKWVKRYYNTS